MMIASNEIMDLQWEASEKDAEITRLRTACDAEMERLKACEHIADGDEGWERVCNLCPSTAAVARLRADIERLTTQAAEEILAYARHNDALRAERDAARKAVRNLMAMLIIEQNGASLNGNVTVRQQTIPASIYDTALAIGVLEGV